MQSLPIQIGLTSRGTPLRPRQEMTMSKLTTTALAALIGLGLALPSFASDAPDATTQAKITEQLTADGYEVRKIDSEDGMIEVYAVKDGKMYEIYLDADLKVVKTKEES
jgi:hypothetical protein